MEFAISLFEFVVVLNVSTYQCSILFDKMGSFNRKSEFRKIENLKKPAVKCEKFKILEFVTSKKSFGETEDRKIVRS